jgi:RNA polymerase sigma-70 factor (ECF subfamily)
MRADLDATLRRASEGDEAAWRDIVEAYTPRLYRLLHSRCRDPELAEELAQSVFVTVAEKLTGEGEGRYVEQGRFESWFFRIAMNRLRDEMRRRGRQATGTGAAPTNHGFDDRADPVPGVESVGEVEKMRRQIILLRDAMEQLSEADREMIELRHVGGLTFRQIAEALNEPLGTVLARQHRALRKLKSWLSERIES